MNKKILIWGIIAILTFTIAGCFNKSSKNVNPEDELTTDEITQEQLLESGDDIVTDENIEQIVDSELSTGTTSTGDTNTGTLNTGSNQ